MSEDRIGSTKVTRILRETENLLSDSEYRHLTPPGLIEYEVLAHEFPPKIFPFNSLNWIFTHSFSQATDIEVLKEKLGQITKECAEKTNFSEEGIKKLHAHDLSETENVQCFQKCFFEKSGIISDTGVDTDRIAAIGKAFNKDEAKTKENLEKCTGLYKADAFDCDAAWEIYKCFH